MIALPSSRTTLRSLWFHSHTATWLNWLEWNKRPSTWSGVRKQASSLLLIEKATWKHGHYWQESYFTMKSRRMTLTKVKWLVMMSSRRMRKTSHTSAISTTWITARSVCSRARRLSRKSQLCLQPICKQTKYRSDLRSETRKTTTALFTFQKKLNCLKKTYS